MIAMSPISNYYTGRASSVNMLEKFQYSDNHDVSRVKVYWKIILEK